MRKKNGSQVLLNCLQVNVAADGVLENLKRFRDLLVSYRVTIYRAARWKFEINFGHVGTGWAQGQACGKSDRIPVEADIHKPNQSQSAQRCPWNGSGSGSLRRNDTYSMSLIIDWQARSNTDLYVGRMKPHAMTSNVDKYLFSFACGLKSFIFTNSKHLSRRFTVVTCGTWYNSLNNDRRTGKSYNLLYWKCQWNLSCSLKKICNKRKCKQGSASQHCCLILSFNGWNGWIFNFRLFLGFHQPATPPNPG